ncbi:MAG: UDP-N-acetylmuramate dehydrogenase [Fidelibacterota bacterium]
MNVEEYKDLTRHTSFAVPSRARYFAELRRPDDLDRILSSLPDPDIPRLVLGGGSNILFVSSWRGLVLHPVFKECVVRNQSPDTVTLSVGAGFGWNALVEYTLSRGWYGLENLVLIPGTVGAAPVQNIGAYGVELADVFVSLEALDLKRGTKHIFTRDDCRFGYRTSRFKEESRFLITSVIFSLSRTPKPNIAYPALRRVLDHHHLTNPAPEEISAIIRDIRRSKLPDPEQLGNAGSFFRNPVVPAETVDRLKSDYPTIPFYPDEPGKVKVPAAWLVEKCGWKGVRRKHCGVYDKHALILVNFGGATGAEIWALAQEIQRSVEDRFGIILEPEPLIIEE